MCYSQKLEKFSQFSPNPTLCESIFVLSTDSGTQYMKELRVSNILSFHFPFLLQSSHKRTFETFKEFLGFRDDIVCSNSRALKGISGGVQHITPPVKSIVFLYPVSQIFCNHGISLRWNAHYILRKTIMSPHICKCITSGYVRYNI